jgi:hypothetical protein
MKKIVSNRFKWIPMNERLDSLGLPLPPRKPETGRPLLWVAIDPQGDFVEDIYLVNETGETLENVIVSTGGCQTFGEDLLTLAGSDNEYKNIEDGDALKIDSYDEMADSDYILQINIKIQIDGKQIKLRSLVAKGGFKEEVLLWG